MSTRVLTTLAQPFIVPAIGVQSQLVAVNGAAFVPGSFFMLAIPAAPGQPAVSGYFGFVQSQSQNTLQVTTIAFGGSIPGQIIPTGATLVICGAPGGPGPQGQQGPTGVGMPGVPGGPGPAGTGPTVTTAPIVVPAVGQQITIPVANGAAYPNSATALFTDGTNAFDGQVVLGGTTPYLTVLCLNIRSGAVGATLALGAQVTFSGIDGIVKIGPRSILSLTPATATGANTAGDSGIQLVDGNGLPNWTIQLLGPGSGYTVDVFYTADPAAASLANGSQALPLTSWSRVAALAAQGAAGSVHVPLTNPGDLVSVKATLVAVRVVLTVNAGVGNASVVATASSKN